MTYKLKLSSACNSYKLLTCCSCRYAHEESFSTKGRVFALFAVGCFQSHCQCLVVAVVESPEAEFPLEGKPTCFCRTGNLLGAVIPSVCLCLVKVLEGGWSGGSLYSDNLPPSFPKGVVATSGKFPASSFFLFSFFPE